MLIELNSRPWIHPVLTVYFCLFKAMLIDCLMASKRESIQDWDYPKQYGSPKRVLCRITLEWDLLCNHWFGCDTIETFIV